MPRYIGRPDSGLMSRLIEAESQPPLAQLLNTLAGVVQQQTGRQMGQQDRVASIVAALAPNLEAAQETPALGPAPVDRGGINVADLRAMDLGPTLAPLAPGRGVTSWAPPAEGQVRLADIIQAAGLPAPKGAERLNVNARPNQTAIAKEKVGAAAAKAGAIQASGAERAATAQARASERTELGKIKTEAQLRGELSKLGTDFRTVQANYGVIKTVAAGKPTPAGDLSLIFAYMKLLDPGSTVREGEQATAANARGVEESVRSLYNRVLLGDKLGPNQRADFLSQAEAQYQTRLATHQNERKQYQDLATRLKVRPENVDLWMNGGGPEVAAPAAPAPAKPAAPKAGTVEDGYRFKGGDPADQKNWEKA